MAALVAAAFGVLTVLMWHTARYTRWERPIIDELVGTSVPGRDFLVAAFQPLPFVLTTLALGCAAAAAGRRRLAIAGVAGCLTAVAAAELVLKPLVDRRRTHTLGVHHHVVRVGSEMFPSAHTTAAAAWAMFAFLILQRRTRLAPLVAVVPLLVGYAVISKQMHYPADVLGGFLLGPVIVYAIVDAGRTLARRRRRRARALETWSGPGPHPDPVLTASAR